MRDRRHESPPATTWDAGRAGAPGRLHQLAPRGVRAPAPAAQAAVRPAEGVAGPDQPHARLDGRGPAGGAGRARKVAWSRSTEAVLSIAPTAPCGAASRACANAAPPWTTRRATPTTRRRAYRVTTCAMHTPPGRTGRGRPRLPVRCGSRKTRRAWATSLASPSTHRSTRRDRPARAPPRPATTGSAPPAPSPATAPRRRCAPAARRPAPAPTPPPRPRRRARGRAGSAPPPPPGSAPPSARPARRRRRSPVPGRADDLADQLVRLVRPVARRPGRRAEGLAARLQR